MNQSQHWKRVAQFGGLPAGIAADAAPSGSAVAVATAGYSVCYDQWEQMITHALHQHVQLLLDTSMNTCRWSSLMSDITAMEYNRW